MCSLTRVSIEDTAYLMCVHSNLINHVPIWLIVISQDNIAGFEFSI